VTYGYAIRGTGNALDNVITGNAGANVLEGLGGNDTLIGGRGYDRYAFGLGDGLDRITDQDATVGNVDTVVMTAGISPEDVAVTLSNGSVVLALNASDRLSIDWIPANGTVVEQVEFADGTVWQLAAMVNPALHAPTVQSPMANQSVAQEAAFTFVVPVDTGTPTPAPTFSPAVWATMCTTRV
jgi:hypothetical protein